MHFRSKTILTMSMYTQITFSWIANGNSPEIIHFETWAFIRLFFFNLNLQNKWTRVQTTVYITCCYLKKKRRNISECNNITAIYQVFVSNSPHIILVVSLLYFNYINCCLCNFSFEGVVYIYKQFLLYFRTRRKVISWNFCYYNLDKWVLELLIQQYDHLKTSNVKLIGNIK